MRRFTTRSTLLLCLSAVLFMGADECDLGGEPDPDPEELPTHEASCTDGLDEDGDGLTDCDDRGDCASDPACWEAPAELCDDRVDNDGDGRIDCLDPDCEGEAVCEIDLVAEECDNDLDDDGDGATDCADSDCASAPSCAVCGDREECDNEEDDDCDGATDCDDPECAREPACYTVDPCADGGCERHSAAEIERAFRVCGLVSGCMRWSWLQSVCVRDLLSGLTAEEFTRQYMSIGLNGAYAADAMWGTLLLADPTVQACFIEAETCDDVFACANEGSPSSDACEGTEEGVLRCDGDTLRTCTLASSEDGIDGSRPRREFAYDCSRVGATCNVSHMLGSDATPDDFGMPGCSNGLCDMRTFTPSCEGGAPVNCSDPLFGPDPPYQTEGHLHSGRICPEGTECRVDEFYGVLQALCVPLGPSCDEDTFVDRCDELGRLVRCQVGQEIASTCPEATACLDRGDGATCFPDDFECDVEQTACDETSGTIWACIDNYQRIIDCRELGFEGCARSTLASSMAYCQ